MPNALPAMGQQYEMQRSWFACMPLQHAAESVPVTALTSKRRVVILAEAQGTGESPWGASCLAAGLRQLVSACGIRRTCSRVLVKPNLIREGGSGRFKGCTHVLTSAGIIQAVMDCCLGVLGSQGEVTIADAPQTDSDFRAIRQCLALDELVDAYKTGGSRVELLDLRRHAWLQSGGVTHTRLELPGDPRGYATVDLGDASEFADYRLNGRFYGADYDFGETRRFHAEGKHQYLLCRTAMDADVIVNVPKMKTHKKTGVTLGLKNMVGVNGYRNCLPHFTIGSPAQGGDEFPDAGMTRKLESRAIAGFKRAITSRGGVAGGWARVAKRLGAVAFGDTSQVVRSGNWYGNDTAWRMVLDINKIVMHYDGEGRRLSKPRRMLTVVDGITGMDGDGPVGGDPVKSGVIVAGLNAVAVDTVCATLMGFDWRKIPLIREAWNITELPLVDFGPDEIECVSNVSEWTGSLDQLEHAHHLGFKAPFGWTGQIERGPDGEVI